MPSALVVTGLLMGLAGGPHCAAMCGAACGGMKASGPGGDRALYMFQAGRLAGYSAMGGLAATSMQGLGWMSVHAAVLRPVWTMLHVGAALLGLMLMLQARQPAWLEIAARKVWSCFRPLAGQGNPLDSRLTRMLAPLTAGLLWALLPCGLLYSALLVAALSPTALDGALVMALFAAGSGISLIAAPRLWFWLRSRGSGDWAIRLAGCILMVASVWALWMGLVHNTAPWCLPA